MNKLRKIILTCIVFCFFTTAIYATSEILPESKFGIKKVAILGAGVFLIVQILFISYQKDKKIEKLVLEKKELEKINESIKIKKEYETKDIELPIFTDKEIVEIEKEEKDLFKNIKIEEKIENLPDEKVLLEKSIIVKKEKNKKDKNIQKDPILRKNIEIKQRKIRKLPEKNIKNEQETQIVEESLVKFISESKKRAKKIAREAKRKSKKIDKKDKE